MLKKAGFRRGRGKSIVPAIAKKSQSTEEQIARKPKGKGENIQIIPSEQKKDRVLQKHSRKIQKKNKTREVHLNDDAPELLHSEV